MAAGAWLDNLNRHLERPLVCRCAFCSFRIRARLDEARGV
jgi:hypothetical protein